MDYISSYPIFLKGLVHFVHFMLCLYCNMFTLVDVSFFVLKDSELYFSVCTSIVISLYLSSQVHGLCLYINSWL